MSYNCAELPREELENSCCPPKGENPIVENPKVENKRLRIPACFAPMMSLIMSPYRGPPLYPMPIYLNRGLPVVLRFKRKWGKFCAQTESKNVAKGEAFSILD
jgi:hypothetical protein